MHACSCIYVQGTLMHVYISVWRTASDYRQAGRQAGGGEGTGGEGTGEGRGKQAKGGHEGGTSKGHA